MVIRTGKSITYSEAQFFLSPNHPLQRQYEALRAYFVEDLASGDAAQRFGYSPGAFRVLCHSFRHDPDKREFFRTLRHGPQNAPARDRVRELAVAMRKRNLSVYDIQRELSETSHPISINALSVLLREEGFARLPRRRDEERPLSLKPEPAAVEMPDQPVETMEPVTIAEVSTTPEAEAIRSYRGLWPVAGIGVDPGPALGDRIRQRFVAMLAAGLQSEVELLAPRLGVTAAQGVGYRELLRVVRGEWTLDRATRTAIAATAALARRQRTFHRRDPRVRWLEWDDEPSLVAGAAAVLEEAGWTS